MERLPSPRISPRAAVLALLLQAGVALNASADNTGNRTCGASDNFPVCTEGPETPDAQRARSIASTLLSDREIEGLIRKERGGDEIMKTVEAVLKDGETTYTFLVQNTDESKDGWHSDEEGATEPFIARTPDQMTIFTNQGTPESEVFADRGLTGEQPYAAGMRGKDGRMGYHRDLDGACPPEITARYRALLARLEQLLK